MPKIVMLAVDGTGQDAEELASWLEAEDELRGWVRRDLEPVPVGALGAGLAGLAVSLGSGGMATAMASVIVTWLRRRAGSVSLKITHADNSSLEFSAGLVHELNAEELTALFNQLVDMAWPDGANPDTADEKTPGEKAPDEETPDDGAGD